MSLEKWRVVPSAPHYLASNAGRIMVAPYFGPLPNGGNRSYGGEPTFGVWAKDAGRFIIVYKGKSYKVHRLVCEAWHGPAPADAPVCIHIDENAANNAAENLKWGSQRENLNGNHFLAYCSERTGDDNPFIKGRIKQSLTNERTTP